MKERAGSVESGCPRWTDHPDSVGFLVEVRSQIRGWLSGGRGVWCFSDSPDELPPSSEMGSTNADDEDEKTLQIELPPVPPERQQTEMSATSLLSLARGAMSILAKFGLTRTVGLRVSLTFELALEVELDGTGSTITGGIDNDGAGGSKNEEDVLLRCTCGLVELMMVVGCQRTSTSTWTRPGPRPEAVVKVATFPRRLTPLMQSATSFNYECTA